jgi:hypothetical protein
MVVLVVKITIQLTCGIHGLKKKEAGPDLDEERH